MTRVKRGIHVSSRLKSEWLNRPNSLRIMEMATTIRTVLQMSRPPMVGVPLFLAWRAAKSVALPPERASSRICLPILNLISCLANQGVTMREMRNARVPEPMMRARSCAMNCSFSMLPFK